MSISLTQAAANRIVNMLEKRGSGIGLRLGTVKSGCSGFAYVVDYADKVEPDDILFESHGVKVLVDKNSISNIDGMELDYVKNNAINEGFEFHNPNVKSQCGCGESFTV